MRVAGFDENGLGPRLGPLVVTGVLIEMDSEGGTLLSNHVGPVDDSKKIFKRDPVSYAKGEAIALAILGAAGLGARDTDDLRGGLKLPADFPLPESNLPLWCSRDGLPRLDARITGIMTRTISPAALNKANKFSRTVSTMVELGQALMPFDLGLFGKVGSRKFYAPFLHNAFGVDFKTLGEGHSESRYGARSAEWRFAVNADALYLPVAMASVVGKYIRELAMLELNRQAGFLSPVPYCSGYPGDPRTRELVRALSDRTTDPWLAWLAMRER